MMPQNTIDNFLKDTDGNGLIVVYGPTACGKSALAIDIAESLESEVISVDARQIYRYMDIGTGKISPEEMRGVPHHMIDIIDPNQDFSVVNFRDMASPIIDSLWKEGKTPVLCGGTGLYIDSLIYERSYPSVPADWSLREELEGVKELEGSQALWNRLHAIDPEYAARLHPNDTHYIMRGIEVKQKTGKSKLEIQDIPKLKYPTLFITPYDGDRAALYTRINLRVQGMFNDGLIGEVGYIINTFSLHCPGLGTIGYAEIVDHLEGKTTRDRAIELVQQHSRNYAKRQITWNKKYDPL